MTSAEVSIVDAIGPHTVSLKDNLRVQDAQEILRFGITVQHALWYSYKHSLIRKTALIDGTVAAMWGCHGTFMGTTGMPWLLTAPEVKKVSPLRFCRIYRNEVEKMLKIFPVLSNYVDATYGAAVRMLENAGFTLFEPEPMGNNGALYRKFEIRA